MIAANNDFSSENNREETMAKGGTIVEKESSDVDD